MNELDWNAIITTLIRTAGWVVCLSIAAPVARLWVKKSLSLRELELRVDLEDEQPRSPPSGARPVKGPERKRQLDRRKLAR
jgi:hypothetical protein